MKHKILTLTLTANPPTQVADGQSPIRIEASLTEGDEAVANQLFQFQIETPSSARFSNGATSIEVPGSAFGQAFADLSDQVSESVTVIVATSSAKGERAIATIEVTFGQAQTHLVAPSVTEAANGQLEAGLAQATVVVAPYTGMAIGDQVALVWKGTPAGSDQVQIYNDKVSISVIGQPVTFAVDSTHIAPLAGGNLTVYYIVLAYQGGNQQSDELLLSVSQITVSLPPPVVEEAIGDLLDQAASEARVQVKQYEGKALGDQITLMWTGNVSGLYSDSMPVTQANLNDIIIFTVPGQPHISNNTTVDLHYTVTSVGGLVRNSDRLTLSIGVVNLPAPGIDEAANGQLDLADVPPTGATARVPASAGLIAGDVVQVTWQGATTEIYSRNISGNDAGNSVTVTIPLATVQASEGSQVSLSYTVTRGQSELVSEVANVDISAIVIPAFLGINTHLNPWDFTVNESPKFPSRAFVGATFTLLVEGKPGDYAWRSSESTAVMVTTEGVVTFVGKPSGPVTITATAEEPRGSRLEYIIDISQWYGRRRESRSIWAAALDWCFEQSLHMPTGPDLTIKIEDDHPRMVGAVYNEWGYLPYYNMPAEGPFSVGGVWTSTKFTDDAYSEFFTELGNLSANTDPNQSSYAIGYEQITR